MPIQGNSRIPVQSGVAKNRLMPTTDLEVFQLHCGIAHERHAGPLARLSKTAVVDIPEMENESCVVDFPCPIV
jgi:hypothetical protein